MKIGNQYIIDNLPEGYTKLLELIRITKDGTHVFYKKMGYMEVRVELKEKEFKLYGIKNEPKES